MMRLKELQTENQPKVNKMNSNKELENVNRSFKKIKYFLRRVVCAKDDQHIVLGQSQQLIDVVPDELMFFKVSVRDKQAPARLLLNYLDGQPFSSLKRKKGQRNVDLRIHYSADPKNSEPTEQECFKVYHNPLRTVPLITPSGRDFYESDWVYLSFYSQVGC